MKKNFMKITAVSISTVLISGMLSFTSLAAVENGWDEVDGKYYWYENGVLQGYDPDDQSYRGKEIYDNVSDAWYWLDNDNGGAKAVSKDVYQESESGQWGDIDKDGVKYGKWVRYDENGCMIKGWSVTDKGSYYFDRIYGTMAKGYATIDGTEYYFNPDTGVMERELGAVPVGNGWRTIDGGDFWYEDGIRQGYSVDDSYRGKEIYDPGSDAWYWLDNVDGGKKAVSKDVYQESQADDEGNIGKWVRYDSSGHMIKGWSEKDGNKYYFDPVYGTMAKGQVDIDGRTYIFDEKTGICNGVQNVSYGVGTEYHTQEEIKNYMAASGADVKNETKLQTESNLSVPYDAGSLTEESLEDALNMLNQIRYIAGIGNDVTLSEKYTQLVQAGAFLNAVNNKMSHYPERPEGMSDELYKTGKTGASSSNIAYANRKSNLSYFITLWMDDSDSSNIDRLGHRRWILNPAMGKTGFGYAISASGSSYAGVYAFDRSSGESVQGVAWPAREMPLEYFDGSMAWSYSYGKNLTDITVKLTCQNEGSDKVWNFSQDSGDGYFNVDNGGYGQTGCVIFKPDGIEINQGDTYLVTITQGDTVIANYTVNFF